MKKLSTVVILLMLFIWLRPVMATENYVFFNDVDNPATIAQIKGELIAESVIDGDLTSTIYVIVDQYSANKTNLGDWLMVFGVTDSLGGETTVAITVRNVDITPPEIIIQDEESLNIEMGSVLSENMPAVIAIDSFEGNLTSSMTITGTGDVDMSTPGEYVLTYTVSDSSGNEATLDVTITVVNYAAPTIDGPLVIRKHKDYIVGPAFFLPYFTAEDNFGTDITDDIEIVINDFIGNGNKPGSYLVRLQVEDAFGNEMVHNLTVTVVSDMIPYMIIDDYQWVVKNTHRLSDADFITILKSIDSIPNHTFAFNHISDTYTLNFSSAGNYQRRFNLVSGQGNEYERHIFLEVVTPHANIIEAVSILDRLKGFGSLLAKISIPIVLFGLFIYGLIKKG